MNPYTSLISRIQGHHKPPVAAITAPKYFLQLPSPLQLDLDLCLASWEKFLPQV